MARKRVIAQEPDEASKILPPEPTAPEPMLPPGRGGVSLPASVLWKTGQSGNPGGQPKGTRITTWLARFGDMPTDQWPEEGSAAILRLPANARIALAQLRRAMDSAEGLPAAAWAADRVEGGVDRTVHLTHKAEPTMSLEDAAEMVRVAGLAGPAAAGELEQF